MDWIILVFLLLYFSLTLVANVKLIFYFEHANDSSLTAPEVVCKLAILAGLQLAWLFILALPLDAYNQHSPLIDKAAGHVTAGLDMRLYWSVVTWFIILYLLLAVPFATFYYEADFDPRVTKAVPWRRALLKTLLAVFFTVVIVIIVYLLCRSISLSFDQEICAQWAGQDVSKPLAGFCESIAKTGAGPVSSAPLQAPQSSKGYFADTGAEKAPPGAPAVKMHVDVSVYLLAAMSFVGWFTFALFGGIGLAALPLDAFYNFRYRPRAISLGAFKEIRRQLGEKAKKLRFIGEALAQEEAVQESLSWREFKRKRQYRTDVNRYKKAVFDLDQEYRQLAVCMRERGENPFYSYLKLSLGVAALLLSIIWIGHTILNCVVPQILDISPVNHAVFGFLDAFLKILADHSLALLALLFYAFLVCYLLLCVIKGCFKFGANVFCFIGIHPMRKDETHLNSFLFNVVLVLVSCAAVIQFTARCFQGYTQSTMAAWIFDVQLLVLPFFGFIFKYNIFIYFFVAVAFITAIALLWKLCRAPPPSVTGSKKLEPIRPFPSVARQARLTTAEGAGDGAQRAPDGGAEGDGRETLLEDGDHHSKKKKKKRGKDKAAREEGSARDVAGTERVAGRVQFAVRQVDKSDSDDDRGEGQQPEASDEDEELVSHRKAWGKSRASRVA
ncbi:putative LMBR1 family region protein [Besnoitia besnoiti]|uniref:Putative LMBR1 family region protein n=1 Tax=Besnoitia besnoiti TaxID=94643 RepID=A0A2A9MDR3_BESBE|nr:putative LMBR1 family region protein [Besnoitia besnoiti]PFH33767.1 putative LMBR1 family region protein [Besnoitia besnoiti]